MQNQDATAEKTSPRFRLVEGSRLSIMEASSTKEQPLTDDVLVARATQGDGIAFSELVSRHYEKAVGTAFGLLKDRQDAEDVAQEAFARVHRKLASFQGQSAFRTWLYRIVVNLSIDTLRKRKRERRADVDDEATREALRSDQALWPKTDDGNPDERLERTRLAEQLHRAFQSLPEIHRAVLLLREIQGFSYDEIARTLKIKKGTVMSRLFHARKAMQGELLTQLNDEAFPEDMES